jgi:hypothetical protein
MEEIRRLDRQRFLKQLVAPHLLIYPAMIVACLAFWSMLPGVPFWGFAALVLAIYYPFAAHREATRNRFISMAFAARWAACEERLRSFEEVLKRLRKDQVADLREMPSTIRKVGESVYVALRKADIISHEVSQTELNVRTPTWAAGTNDPQSQALYRVADRNIAEYRAELSAVMAGVHRAEAQSAVYITTLDSLRVKMLGYRLQGRRPELGSQDFLESLAEAKLQLQSIDKALDELDLGHYPKIIAVVEPGPRFAEEAPKIEENA